MHEVLSHLVQYLPALLIRKSTFDVFPLMEDTHLRIDLNEAKLHGSKCTLASWLVLRIQLIVFTAYIYNESAQLIYCNVELTTLMPLSVLVPLLGHGKV